MFIVSAGSRALQLFQQLEECIVQKSFTQYKTQRVAYYALFILSSTLAIGSLCAFPLSFSKITSSFLFFILAKYFFSKAYAIIDYGNDKELAKCKEAARTQSLMDLLKTHGENLDKVLSQEDFELKFSSLFQNIQDLESLIEIFSEVKISLLSNFQIPSLSEKKHLIGKALQENPDVSSNDFAERYSFSSLQEMGLITEEEKNQMTLWPDTYWEDFQKRHKEGCHKG